ncbi:hypothetical protein H4R35_000119 [Dimargaris xerosporica]|nr:hypothetical protein H4R35_000119 [Dimargaris xerosporica]
MAGSGGDTPSVPLAPWKSFVAGILGDTIKVRLQCQTQCSPRYSGTWNCFCTILRREKVQSYPKIFHLKIIVHGLYKGMASPLAGVALVNAVVFGVYETTLSWQMQNPSLQPAYNQIFIAGLTTGVVSSFITCPMELVKIKLQNQAPAANQVRYPVLAPSCGQVQYRGPIDCAVQTLRRGGLRACYQGMGATMLREASFGPYFVSYELFCRHLTNPEGATTTQNSLALIFAGGLAGIAAWISTYPADVIKTRMQNHEAGKATTSPYSSLMRAFQHCHREGGMRLLFSGLTATIIRAFPCNAATLFVYTTAVRYLNGHRFKAEESVLSSYE